MRTGAAKGHQGYFHEAAFYGSDGEFLDVVLPFFVEGLEAGEPAVAAFGPANQKLVRDALGSAGGVRFIDGEAQYQRPAVAIRRYRELLGEYVAAGATQVRVAGDVPHPGVGVPWDWWARYEAAVNVAYDDFPIWGLCPYDVRITPATVLDEVRRTHPWLAASDGHIVSAEFQDPREFLATRRVDWRDPLADAPSMVDLADPSPVQVRQAIVAAGEATTLSIEDINGLRLAASEAVANAIVHGRPPVWVRLWGTPERLLVAVTDRGAGPTNPYAGLLPDPDSASGLGLWLAHQVCDHVSMRTGPEGYTIYLAVGTPRL